LRLLLPAKQARVEYALSKMDAEAPTHGNLYFL
jgi:hypothetical protein